MAPRRQPAATEKHHKPTGSQQAPEARPQREPAKQSSQHLDAAYKPAAQNPNEVIEVGPMVKEGATRPAKAGNKWSHIYLPSSAPKSVRAPALGQ